MPSDPILGIKLPLQELCHILFHAILVQSLCGQLDGSILHVVGHVDVLDHGLVRCRGTGDTQRGLGGFRVGGVAEFVHAVGSGWEILVKGGIVA
jgi:hypothetical protein